MKLSVLLFLTLSCTLLFQCDGRRRDRRRQNNDQPSSDNGTLDQQEDGSDPTQPRRPRRIMRNEGLECDENARYRTSDGTCNNLMHPKWGSVGQPYLRFLPPAYMDHLSVPRLQGTRGAGPLPSPRQVSVSVCSSHCRVAGLSSVMLPVWGQFIAHDIASTPLEEVDKEMGCCDGLSDNATHPDVVNGGPCFPIAIPPGDCHFPNTSCMEFVRSRAVTDKNGVRQQINMRSSYIDGSVIYGSDDPEMKRLRAFKEGRMKVRRSQGRHKDDLPRSTGKDAMCLKITQTDFCPLAGDDRVNVYPPLTALHTMFVRYHNYVAQQLALTHPEYDDEVLFQEARKIVIAVLQRITHKEFLPRLLRNSQVSESLLRSEWRYKKRCDATLHNVIPTAALRFGHSMVPDYLSVNCLKVGLKDLFLRPHYTLSSLDSVVKNSATERAMLVDQWISDDIKRTSRTWGQLKRLAQNLDGWRANLFCGYAPDGSTGMMNHLLEEGEGEGRRGRDVVSVNIQRGREHGLRSYNHWREFCKLPLLPDFSHFQNLGEKFQAVYSHVDDVDLFPAALAEERVGEVGETLTCLLSRQFEDLRFCDRFWWETKDPLIGFASDKLREEIDKTKLSHVICRTTQVYDIQPDVFKLPNRQSNKEKPCSQILEKAMNLSLF
ncbi:salivary peroxidase/catechol oxidase-like [Babylonia areolata]|uniref:salivary peroxidase/catechol oxidase-like n=1 Tax=Babylonia areolata TaxID=304850 RepID=UPI003FD2DFB8